ncbi:MAG TPA: hypothetical protein DD435_14260 [Cyanobacteria bacterium UBA8530]|nr:hypothetical protein [Cyanobacteria bacterium UBA8530]
MVKKTKSSIVLKLGLYAMFAAFLTFFLAFALGKALIEHGRFEAQHQRRMDQLQFAAREIESALRRNQPYEKKLKELSRSLRVRLEVRTGTSLKKNRRPFRTTYVVPLKVDGKTKGMLRARFWPTRGGRPPGLAVSAVFFGTFIALLFIPPLIFWVIRPIRGMVRIAHRIAGGDLETPVLIDRPDEFGELQAAFEGMRRRIQQMLLQKDRLLRDISHELRAPLSRMTLALSLVRSDSPYFEQLERDIKLLDSLIGELISLSRVQAPEGLSMKSLDLASLVPALMDERAILFEQKKCKISLSLASAPCLGDERLLIRAMGNLLDNAIKFSFPEGKIEVETLVEGKSSLFRVKNEGPQIPEGEIPLLFEPFYRPDTSRTRETGGSGLGLAIVMAVAESHGGKAALSSKDGTLAELRLPSS